MLPLPRFDYHAPETVDAACALVAASGANAKILAGGTDLLVKMKRGLSKPASLVSLNSIPNLSSIEHVGSELRIGALATLSELMASPLVNERLSLLAQALRTMGFPQIRNRATVGGNLCNASPAADTAAALLALDASVKAVSLTGERLIALESFFVGPGRTVLRTDEILTEIRVPTPSSHASGAYLKLSARRNDLATVSVAASLTMDSTQKICQYARVVLGAVAPTAIRCCDTEEMLRGKAIDEALFEEAAAFASETARPISDVRASAEYRKDMVKVFTRRALRRAAGFSEGSPHSVGG